MRLSYQVMFPLLLGCHSEECEVKLSVSDESNSAKTSFFGFPLSSKVAIVSNIVLCGINSGYP